MGGGDQYAVFEQDDILWKMKYVEASATGLAFKLVVENSTAKNFHFLIEDYSCKTFEYDLYA